MEDCLFCKIIKGEIPCDKVYEDDKVISFKDINPEAPVHVLTVPKKHITSTNDLKAEDEELIGYIYTVMVKLAGKLGIAETGYRIISNCGENGGQTVPHIHFHLLGGKKLEGF